MAGISSVSSGQTYISQDNKEIDVGKQIKNTADVAIGTALGGGNVGEAVAKNTINQAFDNMGEVGKIAKFVFNLFMDRKSDALQSKATTSQHGSNAMAQLNSTQQKLQDAAFAALSDLTNGDTILSLQECKTVLNAAVSQIKDKQEVQNKLTEQKETLIPTLSGAKTPVFTMNVINNYDTVLNNVVVLGRTPYAGNKDIATNADLGSTMTMDVASAISVSMRTLSFLV